MRYLFLFFFLPIIASHGQALRDINYSYLYDGSNPVGVSFSTVRGDSSWTTFARIWSRDTTINLSAYHLELETRSSLSDKEGKVIPFEEVTGYSSARTSRVNIPLTREPVILAAKLVNSEANRAWYFYTILEPNYPVVQRLESSGIPVIKKYTAPGDSFSVSDNTPIVLSYYNDVFPQAPVPFSEKLGRVSKGMSVDSTILINANDRFSLPRNGLYLIQSDTNKAEGIAVRVEDDYPRYRKVENLAEPMIYVCTKQEYAKMKQAKGDKRAFDRVILSITRDTERAKKFMRNYFRRVEMANEFFASYKEGWKTDRGMVFIVLGPPQQVFRFSDREVWSYDSDLFKITLEFAKAPSIFDPENFVLIRKAQYQEVWYEVIDLWRNARF